jgi:peptide/nickel transport system permease protein
MSRADLVTAEPLPVPPEAEPVLEVRGLCIQRRRSGVTQQLVTSLDLQVASGEVVGLVGESGSGKSLTALACLKLLPSSVELSGGELLLEGRSLMELDEKAMRRLRGNRISMVFQDPLTSLDPCARIGDQLVEVVRAHCPIGAGEARTMAVELLDRVGIPNAKGRMRSYPHELSGGMRQRVGIAAALILKPSLLLADEPTTALDVTTQAAVLELVAELRREIGMSVVWVSHDLGVVGHIADRVAVMYAGEIVEVATTRAIFSAPQHPYTQGLIDSATRGRPGHEFASIPGVVPEPGRWPPGCRFLGRCHRSTAECEAHPHLEPNGAGPNGAGPNGAGPNGAGPNGAGMVRCFHPYGPRVTSQ